MKFFPPDLPIKKLFVRKGKHGMYFIWPEQILGCSSKNYKKKSVKEKSG